MFKHDDLGEYQKSLLRQKKGNFERIPSPPSEAFLKHVTEVVGDAKKKHKPQNSLEDLDSKSLDRTMKKISMDVGLEKEHSEKFVKRLSFITK